MRHEERNDGRLHSVNNRNVDCPAIILPKAENTTVTKLARLMEPFSGLPKHFFVGYEADWEQKASPLHQLIVQGISGVILFRHHTSGLVGWEGFETLRNQLWQLRKLAHQAGSPQFMIGVDQEGGQVERFGASFFPSFLSPACVAQVTALNPSFATRHYALLAEVLHALGVNLNFFPTVDVNLDENNPIIGIRSFGNSAETVKPLALQAIETHLKAGVLPVVKHFPGHGFGTVDSHHTLPKLTYTPEESSVFQATITEGNAPVVMVSHGYYPALQGTNPFPASLDERIVTTLLRQEMGFNGLSISDDLEMGAILETTDPLSVVQQGLNAGLDLLLYRQGSQAMLNLITEAQQKIVANEPKETEFQQRLTALQTQHPTCFLPKPPPCTQAQYEYWMKQVQALTQEAVTTILEACGSPKLDREAPIWVVLPNAGKVLPHFSEDETTHATLSSLLVKAGCNRVKTSHYSTPEEEALLATLVLAERAKQPNLQVVIATWLPKVGSTLLSTLAKEAVVAVSQAKVFHWAIGGSALPANPSLSETLTELPLFGYRPVLKQAVVSQVVGL
jgi:beta-glucosidase-like glycosyl hydrolase